MLSRIHSCRSFVRPFSAVAQPNLAARIDVRSVTGCDGIVFKSPIALRCVRCHWMLPL